VAGWWCSPGVEYSSSHPVSLAIQHARVFRGNMTIAAIASILTRCSFSTRALHAAMCLHVGPALGANGERALHFIASPLLHCQDDRGKAYSVSSTGFRAMRAGNSRHLALSPRPIPKDVLFALVEKEQNACFGRKRYDSTLRFTR
jgi:hypothetical protein